MQFSSKQAVIRQSIKKEPLFDENSYQSETRCLNVFTTSKNALKTMISRVERPITEKEAKSPSKNDNWWGWEDLNSRPERPKLRA